MRICKLLIPLLAVAVSLVFGSVDAVQAGSGVYPDSPRQIAPLDYATGDATIDFSFASYNYNDGTYVGYPIAYHIEVYHGPTLVVSDDSWSTTYSYWPFMAEETYSWQVYAIYEFYDEYGDYAGMEYTDLSPFATFRNMPATAPSPPEPIFPQQDLQTNKDAYVGGKRGVYWWWTSLGALSYELTVAKDSSFSDKIATYNTDSFAVFPGSPIADLPADGSRIFWKLKAFNEFGESGSSQTVSFRNDCNMPSIGTGGVFSHIDTCTDDVTRIGGNYFLKDMSRRWDNDDHGHHGKMKKEASIITGLNDDNKTGTVERAKGVQIAPMTDLDNKWDETAVQDAIHAQAFTGGFYDYLLSTFEKTAGGSRLNSFNGGGDSMYNLIGGASNCTQDTAAYWESETWSVHYCQNGVSKYPEQVGHEWGHGVTWTASSLRGPVPLTYAAESGALNEAFSDWMGLAYKHAICSSNNLFPSAASIRPAVNCNTLWLYGGWHDFTNLDIAYFPGTPPKYYPNYYNGQWYIQPASSCDDDDNNDNCGVHTNRFVPDIMFYLLAAGGEHPLSKIKVGRLENNKLTGIGIEKAIQIAFRANMEKWQSNASLSDALEGMINALKENFTLSPNDYPNNLHQLKNAWAAVGIGDLPKITVSSSDSGKGTASSSVKTTLINGVQKQYEPVWGGNVTVTATPIPGKKFANWTENGAVVMVENGTSLQPAPQSYTFEAKSDRTLTANFTDDNGYEFGTVNIGQSSPSQTITITNTFKPLITFGQAQLNGTGAADFTKISDSCSGTVKMSNETCSITVAFTPHSVGLREATLDIAATSGGETVFSASYPLSGTGASTSVSAISSDTLGGTVTLSGSQLWGGTAMATATPNTGYAFAGWLEDGAIVSSSPSYSFTVTGVRDLLALFSATPPVIGATPISGIFGMVAAGASSPAHTFTVSNNGPLPLTISAITMSGINRDDFIVTYNNCGQTLSPSASCSIQVNFTPPGAGARTARLNISSNDPATPTRVIDLSGYGGAPAMLYYGGFTATYATTMQSAYNDAGDGMEVRLWASDFDENLNCNRPVTVTLKGGYNGNFADRVGKTALQGSMTIGSGKVIIDGLQIGGTSTVSTVAVQKTGYGTVTISPSGLSCGSDCSSSFLNGAVVTLTAVPDPYASFTGWSGGICSGTAATCSFTLTADTTVTASFTAPASPAITATPMVASFGTLYAGSVSQPLTITVTSYGTQDLVIGDLSLSGSNSAEFVMTANSCSGLTLAPSASCAVQVSFAPASTGAKSANLAIPSNDPTRPALNVSLDGIGIDPTLSVAKGGTGNGTVASSPAGISCGTTCSVPFPFGSALTLTPTADPGSIFTGWSGGLCAGTLPCGFDLYDDMATTATFALLPTADFGVTLSSGSAPATATFVDSSLNASSWFWDFGDGVTSTLRNPAHIYRNPGSYTASLMASNVYGPDTKSVTITVDPCGLPARIGGSYHATIQAAYDAASDGDTVQVLALDFTDNLSAGQGKYVTLDGGYLCGFATNPDKTVLHGAPRIGTGTMKLRNMRIAQ